MIVNGDKGKDNGKDKGTLRCSGKYPHTKKIIMYRKYWRSFGTERKFM